MTKSNQTLMFDVSGLMEASTGTKELYSFKGPVSFDEITVKSLISGKVEVMRLKEGLHAKLWNVEIEIGLVCVKCLKPYKKQLKLDNIERIFLFTSPKKVEDPDDLFLVDNKHQKIELTEPLRQEIILHFPSIPLCYRGCKGICPLCGQERNEKDCNCVPQSNAEHKPLAALKDLLK